MATTKLFTRRYNKETYTFYINKPDYVGEKGICGIELTPYISVETPDNGLGYTDTVLLDNGHAYTLHRYLAPWILRKIEQVVTRLEQTM